MTLLAATVLLFLGDARAAVMTTSLRVSGSAPPYVISYVLGQDAIRLIITIRDAATGETVRTFTSFGTKTEINAADMKLGRHPNALVWDGRMENGAMAPAGTYYAHALSYSLGASTLRLLNYAPLPFTPAPGRTEARGLYGGDANRNPNSPYHNLVYFGVTATNSAGTAGVEVVDADGSSSVFPLPEKTATGAYDYVSASVLDDDTVILDGQSFQRITAVSPANGAIQSYSAVGKVNGRTMRAFGSGAAARAYYINAGETGVFLLNPLSGTPVNIVPASALPGAARGLEVRSDETALYVSGDGGYVRKFNRPASGTVWTQDAGFSAPAMTGEARGLALSPTGTILWVTNNNTADSTQNRVFGVNPATGAALSAGVYQYVFGGAMTPQGIAVTAGGNLFVQGWRGTATGISANSVAVLAPPEGTTMDETVSISFTRPAALGSVQISPAPAATNVTWRGATITWDTNVPSNSSVQLGTLPGVYNRTIAADAAPDLVTHHVVNVDALEAGTVQYARVLSSAEGYATAVSSPISFTTGALSLSGIQVSDVTDTSARLRWNTSAPSTSIVAFGTSPGATDETRADNALTTAHDVTLTGLTPGTAWYATPRSGDMTTPPTPVSGAQQTFTTLKSARILSERLTAGTDAATLAWETSLPVAATVHYGAAPDALGSTISVPSGTSGSAAFPSLSAGTTYYYQISLTGAGTMPRVTPVSAFTTETSTGSARTIVQSDPADLSTARRVNVDLGTDGGLLRLQRQAVPGTPVTTTPLPGARYHHAVVAHNGYLYALGGYDATGAATNAVSMAPILPDGTVGAWSATTPLPDPRVGIADMAFGYSGRLYVVGGADAQFNSLNSVLYAPQNADGTLGAWAETTPLPLPNGRDEGSAIAVDGRVILSGGEDNVSSPATDRARYTAAIRAGGSLGPWTVEAALPDALRGNRARTNADAVYAYGGYGAGDAYSGRAHIAGIGPDGGLSPLAADPSAMSADRYAFTAALTGGKLIAVAGRVRPNIFSRAMEFAPLTADGGLAPWSVSDEQTPDAVDAPDGKAYDGRIYSVGGRKNYATGPDAAATAAVVMVPMMPAPSNGAEFAYSGTLESEIMDLGAPTNLRRLAIAATGVVRARYRFAGENGAFSDWFTLEGSAENISGGARYFQYALTLTGDGSDTPVVDAVALTTGAAVGVPLAGDVNMDGQVTNEDAALALRIAGGFIAAADPSVSLPNADANADRQVTVDDAAVIARMAQ
jgi:hypothetical protein